MLAFFEKIPLTAKLERLFWLLYHSATVRVITLLALTAYAYYPFFSSNNMGNRDAQFYQYMLHDALIQFQNGYFPCYVGQSEFSPMGTPCINAPMYLFFGIFLNLITFGSFSPLLIQHLTIFFSAFLAVMILYALIRNLAPNLKWQAVLIAFLYISCPAIMALPYSLDAYLSYMSVPFMPIVFYCAVQIFRKNSWWDCILLSVVFSCLLMAHAPITLWIIFLFGPFLLMIVLLQSHGILKLTAMAVLFFMLTLWQVIPILTVDQPVLASNEGFFVPPVVLDRVIQSTLLAASDALKPLSYGKSVLSFLQLGYGLWILLLVSMAMIFKKPWKQAKLNYIFCAELIVIGLFIFPVFELGNLIWKLLPNFLLHLSSDQITMRLYPILAAISAIYVSISLEDLKKNLHKRSNLIINLLLGLIFIWAIHEVKFFIAHGIKVREHNASTQVPANSWEFSEYLYYLSYGLPSTFILNGFTAGNLSSNFLNTLRNENYQEIADISNQSIALNHCFNSSETVAIKTSIVLGSEYKIDIPTPLSDFEVLPNKSYLLCIDQDSELNKKVFYQVLDTHLRERAVKELPGSIELSKNHKVIIPINIKGKEGLDKEKLQLRVWSTNGPTLKINKIGLMKDPESINYPLKVLSQTPYSAMIDVGSEGGYVELVRLFKPGYAVSNNGQAIKALESDRNTMLIPLQKNEKNTIIVEYNGTRKEQISLLISKIFWIILIVYILIMLVFLYKNEFKNKQS